MYKYFLCLHFSDNFRHQHWLETGESLSQGGRTFEIPPTDISRTSREKLAEMSIDARNSFKCLWDSLDLPTLEQVEAMIEQLHENWSEQKSASLKLFQEIEQETKTKPVLDWQFAAGDYQNRRIPYKNSCFWGEERTALVFQWLDRYREAKNEADRRAKEEAEEAAEEAKEKKIAARMEWAAQYGSDRLRLALQQGYDCKTLYIRERLEQEHPGFRLITDEDDLRDRSCPSLKALQSAVEHGGEVLWNDLGYGQGEEVVFLDWIEGESILLPIDEE